MTKLSATLVSSSLLFVLGSAGCGPTENANVNEAMAKEQVSAAVETLVKLQAGKGGDTAVASMMVFGSSSMSMLSPKSSEESRQATQLNARVLELAKLVKARSDENCSCDEDKCVFDKCKLENFGTLDGKLSWGKDFLKCDYKADYNLEYGGMKAVTSFSIFCDLKYTDTSLDGTLSTKGSVEVSAQGKDASTKWESSYSFNKIEFDSSGKVKSGSAMVEVEVDAGGKEALYGKAEIDFSSSSKSKS